MKHNRECFITFLNTEKRVENTTEEYFDKLRDVWKCDETLS